ncbi:MAG TPA: phosphatase PAP2 family protein [Pedobacter sp.]|jgi:undecaprenyl-diphosphatase
MTLNRKRILFYVLGVLLAGFILLTTLVFLFPNSGIDQNFSAEIQEHQMPALNVLMRVISYVGVFPYSMVMVLITAFVFLIFNYKKEALFICFTLISGLVSSVLKILVNRPRPTEDVVRIIEKAKNQSFPSGHVLFYVLFFGFLAVLMFNLKSIAKPLRFIIGGISLFMVFTVPFSRVYLGAHWFTDVLGGFLLGMLCLLILSYMYLRKAN